MRLPRLSENMRQGGVTPGAQILGRKFDAARRGKIQRRGNHRRNFGGAVGIG